MLALHGTPSFIRGFDEAEEPLVLRLRAADSGPSVDADAALLRTFEDAAKARKFGFSGAIVIGDKSLMTHPLLNQLPPLDSPSGGLRLSKRGRYRRHSWQTRTIQDAVSSKFPS
jgi:hypothetical protein